MTQSQAAKNKPELLSLPSEALGEILTYLECPDLFSLMLVSRAMHELSAAELYRCIDHQFGNGFMPRDSHLPADDLTDILQTLITSGFNYATFVKAVYMGVSRINDLAIQDRLSSQLRFDTPCGKFFNTLLFAAIKKIPALETFHWDIRVQLSPSIFEVLGNSPSLKNLHVRMHPSPSPPRLNNILPMPPPWPPASAQPVTTLPSSHPHHHGPPPPSAAIVSPVVSKIRRSTGSSHRTSTFSAIKRLKSLAVLDMESLDYLDEIADCISASSTSLKTLKLSFSSKFSAKTRKKKPVIVHSDSESSGQDDDPYDEGPPTPPHPPIPASQSLAATASASTDERIRNERNAQDKALSRIFGQEKKPPVSKLVQKIVEHGLSAAEQEENSVARSQTAPLYKALSQRILDITKDINQSKATLAPKTIEKLQKATTEFLDGLEKLKFTNIEPHTSNTKVLKKYPSYSDQGSSLVSENDLNSPTASGTATGPKESFSTLPPDTQGSISELSSAPERSSLGQSNDAPSTDPNDTVTIPVKSEFEKRLTDVVDMEHPDDLSEGDDQEFIDTDDTETPRMDIDPQTDRVDPLREKGKEPVRQEPSAAEGSVDDGENHLKDLSSEQAIQEYIRLHHGIALDSLYIQLIPLKASVLGRALNLWSLKHISLIEVGPQRPFWLLLSQLHSSNPLQLTSIHTDNVTTALLEFVGSLDLVEELFLIKRKEAPQPDASASNVSVRIDQIYNLVLRKHIIHLKRLMIRNDVDWRWKLDQRTALLITMRGLRLVELAVVVDSPHFHFMTHFLQRMRSLVAWHILLSSSDYCEATLREIRLCALNIVFLSPSLKIQFVAVSHISNGPVATRVSEILRTPARPKDSKFPILRNGMPLGLLEPSSFDQVTVHPDGIPLESPIQPQPAPSFPDENDENYSRWFRHNLSTISTALHEIEGIKIWEKEIYYSNL